MTPAKLTTSQRIKQNKPLEVWESPDGSWRWKVFRKYQKSHTEAKNPYARWFCGVASPFTYGLYELGDVYARDITGSATLVYSENTPDEPHE